ncbi:hypothetical protein [Bacillus sp. Marseille-P3800]|uniref:hypothetical protein n=1 Tax=Bacillus sp. Marseille-P3800 TaxID=2014782 RepID=UPI000C07B043|nr:hypothetical protein [Bacillus sp. Marseille-P3800]
MSKVFEIKRLILSDMLKAFTMFWLTLTGFLFIGYVIASFMGTSIVLLVWPIFLVWLCANSFLITKNNLNYALKLGATRTQFFAGSVLILLIAVIVGQLIHRVYLFVLPNVAAALSIENVTLIGFQEVLPELSTLYAFGYDLTFAFFLLGIFYLIGVIRYQYGIVPVYVLAGSLGVLLLLPMTRDGVTSWLRMLYQGEALGTFFLLAIIGVVACLASQPVLRKMTLR